MKRTTWILATSIALVLWGCDDGRGDGDAGGIVLMDSGPGGGTDSGPGDDAGPGMTGMCALSSFGPLPAACFPRCTMATLVAANNCAGQADPGACQQAAFAADTTPSITLTLGTAGTQQLDCAGCVGWQQNTCVAESCPTEFMAFTQCDPMMDPMMCNAEIMAVNACAMTNMATVQPCVNMRATACFDQGTGGFFPMEPRLFETQLSPGWALSSFDPSLFANF